MVVLAQSQLLCPLNKNKVVNWLQSYCIYAPRRT